MRSIAIVAVLSLLLLPSCKKKPRPDYVPIAEALPRAAKFEPVFEIVKKLPVSPPAVTRSYGPADAFIGNPTQLGVPGGADPYLIIHAEDLAAPPRYFADDKVKVRISESTLLNACVDGLAQVKAAKEETVHKATLARCTDFKYGFVIKTTDYVQPKLREVGDKTVGNTRTITQAVVPGRVAGDVTIYSLADGKEVGAFQFVAVSSDKPSDEGGIDGAVDRDLKKQADVAIRAACSNKNNPPVAVPAAAPAAKKKK